MVSANTIFPYLALSMVVFAICLPGSQCFAQEPVVVVEPWGGIIYELRFEGLGRTREYIVSRELLSKVGEPCRRENLKQEKLNLEHLDIFAGVGRTALSNYLLQTIIGTSIFYGYGLGLYGHVERIHQILIVIGVWLWLVVLTHWWLQYFRFGPFEWAWRSLAYWKVQPLRNPEPEFTTN